MYTLNQPKKMTFSEGTVILDPKKKYESVKSIYEITCSANPHAATLFRDQLETILEFLYQKRLDYASFNTLEEKMALEQLYRTIMSDFNELNLSLDEVYQKIQARLHDEILGCCSVKDGQHIDFLKRRIELLVKIEYDLYRDKKAYETGLNNTIEVTNYLDGLKSIKVQLKTIAIPCITGDATLATIDTQSLLSACTQFATQIDIQIRHMSVPLTSPERTPTHKARKTMPNRSATARIAHERYSAMMNQTTPVITGNLLGETDKKSGSESTYSQKTSVDDIDGIVEGLNKLGIHNQSQTSESLTNQQDSDDEFDITGLLEDTF